ncbi:hypothetical protein GGF44_001352, partial [Coemansia sp. RSA 1694]
MLHPSPSLSAASLGSISSSSSSPQPTNNNVLPASCVQTLTARGGAVLAVAHSSTHVFCGSQQGTISVWRRDTWRLEQTLAGHAGGCHALAVDAGGSILFSGGGDGRVRAWDVQTLRALFAVHAGVNSGAVLALATAGTRVVLGCQNTSLQSFDVAERDAVPRTVRRHELLARRLRFFDDANAAVDSGTEESNDDDYGTDGGGVEEYFVAPEDIVDFAHSGYVYSLAADAAAVYSGGSDGAVRLWRFGAAGLEPAGELSARTKGEEEEEENNEEEACVHALALDGDGLLFAGLQSGGIDVWDLETRQRIRTLPAHRANVFALATSSAKHHCLFSASADGDVRVWSGDLQPLGVIGGSPGVLAVAAIGGGLVVAGCADATVGVWDVAGMQQITTTAIHAAAAEEEEKEEGADSDVGMVQALAQWVRLRSVSGVAELQPECRRAARFLRDLAQRLGASDARLISSTPGNNPLVYARFDASQQNSQKSSEEGGPPFTSQQPTVFVYGHYDVMPAGDAARWASPPFTMTGRDGHVYGRGVSDDKGPVLAMLFAVAELHAARQLPLAVVFCIEGEEENGSRGLRTTIAAHRALFGVPRLVLLSSSYWLGDATPCLTYGMRGSIRATVRVEASRRADVHSGVWGGAVNEPLTCLAHVLSSLVAPSGRVLVPGFHDAVRAVDGAERLAMRGLAERATTATSTDEDKKDAEEADVLAAQLLQRWRQPALTVHHVDVSTVAAPSNATLVPAAAQAAVSVRVVPDQALDDIAAKLRAHIEAAFNAFVAAR